MATRAAQRGDFTGRERTRLTEEKAKQLVERQKEIGLVNQVDIVVEEEGIYDPISGEMVELSPEAQAKIDKLQEPTVVDEDKIYDPAEPQSRVEVPKVEHLEPQPVPKPTRPNALQVEDLGAEPVVVDQQWRVIRVNTDIEDMTYGAGNILTFLRGRRYRVPPDLYDWLETRGVIYH